MQNYTRCQIIEKVQISFMRRLLYRSKKIRPKLRKNKIIKYFRWIWDKYKIPYLLLLNLFPFNVIHWTWKRIYKTKYLQLYLQWNVDRQGYLRKLISSIRFFSAPCKIFENLKGVFVKNESGYRLTSKEIRWWLLQILQFGCVHKEKIVTHYKLWKNNKKSSFLKT